MPRRGSARHVRPPYPRVAAEAATRRPSSCRGESEQIVACAQRFHLSGADRTPEARAHQLFVFSRETTVRVVAQRFERETGEQIGIGDLERDQAEAGDTPIISARKRERRLRAI